MNKFIVNIKQNGTWQAINATPVFPFSWGELLDERLDEAYITVYDSPEKTYPRLTEVQIVIVNGSKVKYEYFIVASDNAHELPVGSGKYKHDIYLIERTKLLEGIFCSTITFTNSRKDIFVGKPSYPQARDIGTSPYSSVLEIVGQNLSFPFIASPVPSSQYFPVPSSYKVAEYISQIINERNSVDDFIPYQIWIPYDNTEIITSVTVNNQTYEWEDAPLINVNGSFSLTYDIVIARRDLSTRFAFQFVIQLEAIPNRLPLKRWSITDCITRACELADPLFSGETPKYRLDGVEYDENGNVIKPYPVGSLAEKYDKVFAPEFTATEDTLREQIKLILSYVHAEPWLDENNVIQATEYGGTVKSAAAGLPYVYDAVTSHINEYCTEIRSHAQNLVSSLGYARGVITDPGDGLYRSVRSDTAYVRINENNGIAVTRDPIYTVEGVKCGIAQTDGTGWRLAPVEITPYVFEETEYSANLSSYAGGYPYSKQYAIYYTQGAPNIKGLFYKAPDNISAANFSPFSISNILSSVTGIAASNIDDMLTDATGGAAALVFLITYKPISNHFVSHGKQLYVKGETPYMQLYNQSENLVESQYYGENLRGVAARLGNVEKERTFILKDIDDVPRVGQLLDGYAISAVSCELYPFDIKCTVGLSKDFNRISEYVGVNSTKRMYEISERAAVDRALLIKETLVIGTRPTGYNANKRIFADLTPFYNVFDAGTDNTGYKVSVAEFYPKDRQGAGLTERVYLPVISRALGNVLTFNFGAKDNYSAGTKTQYITGSGNNANDITGRWENDVPYADYYGRVYQADVRLFGGNIGAGLTAAQLARIAYALPQNTPQDDIPALIEKAGFSGHLLRKDNREKITYNVELDIKTDRPEIIVGSALADLCGWVNDSNVDPVVYHFDATQYTIGKFDRTYTPHDTDVQAGEFEEGITGLWSVTKNADGSLTLDIVRQRIGYGWVLCTPIKTVTEEVEDEDGNTVSVTYQTGGEILLASNAPIDGSELLLDFFVVK